MKLATRDLVSLLTNPNYTEFWKADLFRIVLSTGQDLRFSSSDVDVKLFYKDIIVGSHPLVYYTGVNPDTNEMQDELPSTRTALPHGSVLFVEDSPLADGSAAISTLALWGVSGYMTLPFSENWFRLLRAFSYECWFKGVYAPSRSRNTPILSNQSGPFELWWDSTSYGMHARVYLGAYGIKLPVGVSRTELAATTWYHIVVTWDGTALKLYLNGLFDSASDTTDKELEDNSVVTDDGVQTSAWIGKSAAASHVVSSPA
jgi:hypothetical protein